MKGRPRKTEVNAVVQVEGPRYYTIIDYRDDVRWGRYLAVETDAIGRNPRGNAVWLDSTEFEPTDRTSRPPGRIYRRQIKENGAPEMRGCGCQCCVHVKGVEDD